MLSQQDKQAPRFRSLTPDGTIGAKPLRLQSAAFFSGGGEMGARMRALDWTKTALGDPEHWPQSLRTAIRILLTSKFAMWMAWGPDLTFFCNDAYLPTTGDKQDWVLGARADRVWAEIWPEIGPRIDRVLSTGEATWDEALRLYLERQGFAEESYHTFSYSPLADDAGDVVGMLCVVAEVTKRVIGERQLDLLRDLGARLSAAATRQQVMTALRGSLDAAAADIPFALVYLVEAGSAEARLACAHGLQPGGVASPSRILLHDACARWPLAHAPTRGEPIPIDADDLAGLPGEHGRDRPHQAIIAPIAAAEDGAPLGYVVAGLNPHRAFDAVYRGFIDLVTGQVAAAITRVDEYESAKARAEALAEIDRAKTAFFSNISHEFRTPLTLMLGPLEAILAKPAEAGQADDRALAEVAYRNAQRLLRLVNTLLDFSRIESERAEAHFRRTDLVALTTELASTFRSAIDRAGLRLVIDCEAPRGPVFIDRDMWEKIVLNLLSNAFKFTFEGAIAVRLRSTDDHVVLEVEDTGVGIPAAELPRLFERFHRVQGAQGRSFEGSGIGLALVQDLVKLHGGSVSATSEPGAGTTFTVAIPLGRDHLPAESVALDEIDARISDRAEAFAVEAALWLPDRRRQARLRSAPAAGDAVAAPPASPSEGYVLVADDNADLRDYVRSLLQGRGYQVTVVGDGLQALEAARRRRPDLLLTDVMMPRLDGFELLAAIRADADLADVPVVMLSARAGEEAKVGGLEAGADDYLAKPFSARELLARVSANLDLARARRLAAEQVRASEARLQIEREFLASVLAKAPVGFSIVDEHGRMLMLNERGVELLGHRFEASGPADFAAYGAIHPDGRPYAPEEYPTLRAARGEQISSERMIYLRGGAGGAERILLDVDAVPIRDVEGRPAGAVTVFDDAGARERAEEALRARVDRAVAEREAAREELHQLQKLETIGQLTGGVAHDFNNLLTPIVGALDILGQRYALDERAERLIAGAQQSAERARVLISRLLTFGRRQHLEPRPVDLGALLRGMSDLIRRSLSPQIEIAYAIEDDLPAVIADPGQLELALLNLCVNSRDAMPDGGRLDLSVETVDGTANPQLQPGRYVCVSVSDTGVGMDRETLQRAIEPFYTTKPAGRGTGLGLSMVHGLAAQSGGLFELASAKGEGTTARIYLPAVDVQVEAPRPAAAPPPVAAVAPARILLVDDDDLVRAGACAMLEALGHEVRSVASTAGALQLIRAGVEVDLLVADYMMPGMTGVALIRQARSLRPGLLALLITGYAAVEPQPDDGVPRLGKPFGQEALQASIAALLSPRVATVTAGLKGRG